MSKLAEEIAERLSASNILENRYEAEAVALIDQKLSGLVGLGKFVELRGQIIERRNRQQVTDNMEWGAVFNVGVIFKLAQLYESLKIEE